MSLRWDTEAPSCRPEKVSKSRGLIVLQAGSHHHAWKHACSSLYTSCLVPPQQMKGASLTTGTASWHWQTVHGST